MLARRLAGFGLRVLVQDIRLDAARHVAQKIGNGATAIAFDVSDRAACMAAAQNMSAQGETLSFLWINAGVASNESVLSAPPETISWAYGVNVLGAVWTAQAFAPLVMSAEGPRHIGFTASVAALRMPAGAYSLYAATKQASLGVAEALRAELSRADVPMTILCPGLVRSGIWNGVRARPERYGGPEVMPDTSDAGAPWREAKDPEIMWPYIQRTIENGGDYVVCATDEGATRMAILDRLQSIGESVVEV
jgi:NAD(P)-dependent dehydrogenase (short-subunit alcohol dehydrogenase family)